MFSNDRDQLRRFIAQAWQKRQRGDALQPLERLVAQIVEQHPEYHAEIADPDRLGKDFSPEDGRTNPWLHMAMHITLGEQLGADRPGGIRALYQQIAARHGDTHAAEHAMMECLGLALWEAQRDGRQPDEAAYLGCLRRLSG